MFEKRNQNPIRLLAWIMLVLVFAAGFEWGFSRYGILEGLCTGIVLGIVMYAFFLRDLFRSGS